MRKAGPAWAGLLLFWGCASGPKTVGQNRKVAVLPMANESVNVDAPVRIRARIMKEFGERGFVAVSTEAVDLPLRELGFTDGGQFKALKFEDLAKAVPADWYVYGDVKAYQFKSAAVLSQREVEVELRVVSSTGGVVFEGDEKGITTRGGVDAAGDLALNVVGKVFKGVKNVGKKVVQKTADATGSETASNTSAALGKAADATDVIADVDMTQETNEALRKLFDKLAPEHD